MRRVSTGCVGRVKDKKDEDRVKDENSKMDEKDEKDQNYENDLNDELAYSARALQACSAFLDRAYEQSSQSVFCFFTSVFIFVDIKVS